VAPDTGPGARGAPGEVGGPAAGTAAGLAAAACAPPAGAVIDPAAWIAAGVAPTRSVWATPAAEAGLPTGPVSWAPAPCRAPGGC
jgi:hypothetical protein